MVPRDELANAVTLNSASFNAARAFGPSIGAVILALRGPGAVFAFNTVSYSAVLITLWRRPPSKRPEASGVRPRVMREFKSTLKYVRASKGLTTAMVLGGVLGLVGNPLAMMVVPFARRVYHSSGARTSLLAAAIGTGAVLLLLSGGDERQEVRLHRAPVQSSVPRIGVGLGYVDVSGSF